MKHAASIIHAEAWRVSVPLLTEWTSSPEFGALAPGQSLILHVRDGDGFEGWGEGPCGLADTQVPDLLARLCDGDSNKLRAQFLDALYAPDQLYWQKPAPPSPYAPPVWNLQHRLRHPAQAVVEMAITDLATRRAGIPFNAFFGGAWREWVPVDYWVGRATPEHAAACARRAHELGFRGMKMKSALEDPNVQRLEAIRDAVGADFMITVDPNGRFYRLDDAWKTIRAMDAVGNLAILEDPFPRHAMWQTRELRERGINARVVIHIDPSEWLADVLRADCCGGLNMDSCVQGLFNWRMGAATADRFQLPVWHGSGLDLGIYTAAQLHLACSAPNCLLAGDQAAPWLRESTLLREQFVVRDGKVRVPQGPGLGITPDLDAIERYTIQRFQHSS